MSVNSKKVLNYYVGEIVNNNQISLFSYIIVIIYPARTQFNGLIIQQEIEQGRDAGTSLRQKLPDKSKA